MLIAGVAAGLLTLSGAGTALAHTPPADEQDSCVYEHHNHHPGDGSPEDPDEAQGNDCGEQ